jgi:hypothetical protein
MKMSNVSSSVDHPQHYGGDTVYEVIKVLEAWLTPEEFIGFCKGSSIKYAARHRQKGGLEDLEKQMWYDGALIAYCRRHNINPTAYSTVTKEEMDDFNKMLAERDVEIKRLERLLMAKADDVSIKQLETELVGADELKDLDERAA